MYKKSILKVLAFYGSLFLIAFIYAFFTQEQVEHYSYELGVTTGRFFK